MNFDDLFYLHLEVQISILDVSNEWYIFGISLGLVALVSLQLQTSHRIFIIELSLVLSLATIARIAITHFLLIF